MKIKNGLIIASVVLLAVVCISLFAVLGNGSVAYAAGKTVLTSEMFYDSTNFYAGDCILEDDVTLTDRHYSYYFYKLANAKSLTIDLCGHTLTIDVPVYVKSNIIVKDTVGGGEVTTSMSGGGGFVVEEAETAIFENVRIGGFDSSATHTTVNNCTVGGISVHQGRIDINSSTVIYVSASSGAVVNINEDSTVISNNSTCVETGSDSVVNVKGTVINNNQTISETGDYSGLEYACFKANRSVINVYDQAVIESKKGTAMFKLDYGGVLNFVDETERQVSFSQWVYEMEGCLIESVVTGLDNYPENFNYEDYFTYVPVDVPTKMLRNANTGDIDVKVLGFTQQPATSDTTVDVNIPEDTTYQWNKYQYYNKRLEASDFISFSTYDLANDEITESSQIYDATNKTFSGVADLYGILKDNERNYDAITLTLAQGEYTIDEAHQTDSVQFSRFDGEVIRLRFMDGENVITTDDISIKLNRGTFDPNTGIFESVQCYSGQIIGLIFKNKKTCTMQVLSDIPMEYYLSG